MKNKKLASNIVLMVMAVIMLVVGVYVLMGASEYARKGVKTEAEITSIVIGNSSNGEKSYKVNVEFWVDGTKYGGELDTYDGACARAAKPRCIICPTIRANFTVRGSTICRA